MDASSGTSAIFREGPPRRGMGDGFQLDHPQLVGFCRWRLRRFGDLGMGNFYRWLVKREVRVHLAWLIGVGQLGAQIPRVLQMHIDLILKVAHTRKMPGNLCFVFAGNF